MKKILLGMMAAVAALFTSCSQGEFNLAPTGDTANVIVNLLTPEIGTRAYGDGTSANLLQYAVYDITDGTPVLLDNFTKTDETISLTKQVNFRLANGRTYNLVFWAASSNASGQYGVNFDTNKAEMTVNYGDFFKANCEDLDAFYACKEIKVSGDASVDVKMYRPFAQINVGTDDYAVAAAAGAKPTMSSVTVSNVYTTLDLMTGDVDGERSYTFSDNAIAAPYDEGQKTGEKFPVDKYDYLAMAYALVDKEQSLTTVSFTYSDGKAKEEITVGNVPVQRNFRTNIYGSILTSGIVANVEIVPAFATPDNNMETAAMCTRDEDNKIVCVKPALPEEVTVEEFAKNSNAGVVTINAEGEAVYFPTTSKGLLDAMNASETGEIYLAPNTTFVVKAHEAKIPAKGIKIYGNGATITGGEFDFSLDYTEFVADSEVDIYIENLNNARIWGDAKVPCTLNVTLNNCTFIGGGHGNTGYSGGFIMMRGTSVATHNITLQDCYCEGVQVGMHSANAGTFTVKNCTFKEVGIPVNIAKKSKDNGYVLVEGSTFTKCGLAEDGPDKAWNYSAPIRVVDNAGPHKSTYLKVDKCTFEDTQSLDPKKEGKCDILLVEYRTDDMTRRWYDVDYDITNCGEYTLVNTCETLRGE